MDVTRIVVAGMLLLTVALAGCAGVFRSTSEIGVNDACQQTTPRFVGQDVTVDDWQYTGTNSIKMTLHADTNVTVTKVTLDWEDSDAWTWTGRKQVATGEIGTVALQGNGAFPGGCRSGSVTITYDSPQITGAMATGQGLLQGKAP